MTTRGQPVAVGAARRDPPRVIATAANDELDIHAWVRCYVRAQETGSR